MTFQGFFTDLCPVVRKSQPTLVPWCDKCGLRNHCRSPLMPVDGKGKKKILLLGEAPGKDEDKEGRPFVGASGQELEKFLGRAGIDMREDCWITNSIICRSHTKDGKNRNPTPKEIDYCRPNVIQTVQELKPHVIVPLGKWAVRSLIGWLWKDDPGEGYRWVGWQIPSQRLNAWICPNFHPAHLLYEKHREVIDMYFLKYLRGACDLWEHRPWKKVPDYRARLRLVYDPAEAAEELLGLIKGGRPLAFDFETDRLKPYHPNSSIVCCSVSDGKISLSFPWVGEAVRAMKEFFRSPAVKWGWNAKFEDTWVRALFGQGVRGWDSDGMLNTHVLDNRQGICSIKFQAFTSIGVDSWDDLVKPFLRADGSNVPNRIREFIDLYGMGSLLEYNAFDSLYEWLVIDMQNESIK